MLSHVKYVTLAAAAGFAGGLVYILRFWRPKGKRREIKLPESWTLVGKLTNIYIYPIKSCGPVEVGRAECYPIGLRDGWLKDRAMMIIDQKNNCVTARGFPQLLQVKPGVKGSVLTLSQPDQEICTIDLAEVLKLAVPITATIWGVPVKVSEAGFEAIEWFSRLLDRSSLNFRLVMHTADTSRKIRGSTKDNAEKFTEDDMGVFPDETSYNLINEASIDDINSKLVDSKVSHKNFRPNFVVRGNIPFDEDNWTFVKIGSNIFENIKPCQRCIMTTMDPNTGVRSPLHEPLKTLKTYRQTNDPELRRFMGSSPRMGAQMALRSGPGIVSVDDDVYYA